MTYEVQHDPDHPGRFRVVSAETGQPYGSTGLAKADAVQRWRHLEAIGTSPGQIPEPAAED